MRLNDISIKVAGLHSVGSTAPLLNEIVTCLERYIASGEPALIDLKSLPFAPAEYEGLRAALGRGEVSARLNAMGDSEAYETQFPGVWWVTHYNVEGDIVADLIEIAAVPEILKSPPEDMRAGLERLKTMQEQAR